MSGVHVRATFSRRLSFNQHAKKIFFKIRLLPVGRERYLKNAFYPDLNFIRNLQSHGVRAEGKGNENELQDKNICIRTRRIR